MEVLDFGPPPTPPGRRRLVLGAIATVAAAAIVGSVLYGSRTDESASLDPSPTPTASRTLTPRVLPTPPATSGKPSIRRWRTDDFLPGTDLDLFARSETHLYRIQTRQQLITDTTVPDLESGGSLLLIPTDQQVIMRGWGSPAIGVRVLDGRAPQLLPDALTSPDQLFPGPPGRLWATSQAEDGSSVTRLTDLDGRPAEATSGPSSYQFENLQSDGNGGLILSSAGGSYVLGAGGPRRLSRGVLQALNTKYALSIDCDETLLCSRTLLDRRTGQVRRIGSAAPDESSTGTLSADGRYAALGSWGRYGTSLRVLDLRTNKVVVTLDANDSGDWSSLIWLPDNRLITVLDQELIIVDPARNKVDTPNLGLGRIWQVAVRPRG